MGFIVVGIDGSETSQKAFKEAIREADWRSCSLLAVHVVPYPVVTGYEYGGLDFDLLRSSGEEFLAAELSKLEQDYDGKFPVPVDSNVAFGHTGAEIIKAAEGGDEGPADLVVLGTRGLGGFRGLLLGSVTTYAAHHLPCQLLVVPVA